MVPTDPQEVYFMADRSGELVQGTLDMLILKTLALESTHGYLLDYFHDHSDLFSYVRVMQIMSAHNTSFGTCPSAELWLFSKS